MSATRWHTRRFAAMGTRAHVVLLGHEADAAWVEHEVRRLEARWSRFAPMSDVARINRAAGRGEVAVAPETTALVETAIEWWWATGGRFDPTILGALEALGYDATFPEVRARPTVRPMVTSAPDGLPALRIAAVGPPPAPSPAPGCGEVVVDRAAGTVQLPAGVALDLGGIGKGAAADHVAAGLRERGVASACIGLGGDIRAYGPGNGPGGTGWAIPVEDPSDGSRVLFTHVVDDGAIVTSTDRFRRWVVAGHEHHHLLDPATGLPARTGIVAVVVADHSCARAEVLAKAAFVAGADEGAQLLDRFGAVGWFVDTHPVAAVAG